MRKLSTAEKKGKSFTGISKKKNSHTNNSGFTRSKKSNEQLLQVMWFR